MKVLKVKEVRCRYCRDTGIMVPVNWKTLTLKQLLKLEKEDCLIECDYCDKPIQLKKPFYGPPGLLRDALIANDYGAPPTHLYDQWIKNLISKLMEA